ncbi:Z1 domain-containing protein, partial [Escherichia coli]
WREIVDKLYTVIENVSVRMINGTAKDALDYSDSATGLKVIAIGGDKLARGLTLEGLCTSYFLRASRMYDTLMQMGRWFGYRQGYLDVCRLYTTDELIEWFEHIADASEELREEFDNMVASGGTPRDFGLKVKSHPVLMVTSPLKMRSARSLWLSFSGTVVETISLFKEPEYHKRNYAAFQHLTGRVGSGAPIPERRRAEKIEKWKGVIWQN